MVKPGGIGKVHRQGRSHSCIVNLTHLRGRDFVLNGDADTVRVAEAESTKVGKAGRTNSHERVRNSRA